MPDVLEDSIRGAQKSKRRPDTADGIQDAVSHERTLKVGLGRLEPIESDAPDVTRTPRRSLEDTLPLSPSQMAKQGLTSILPPMRAKEDPKFRRFLLEITDPDLRFQFPTWTSLAAHFETSVQTIKTWCLSDEMSQALAIGISHEARLMMPSVLRSVKLRAEMTGDPHAAEFIRKLAKLGTAETDVTKSFESTLRAIAAARSKGPALLPPKTVDVKVVVEGS